MDDPKKKQKWVIYTCIGRGLGRGWGCWTLWGVVWAGGGGGDACVVCVRGMCARWVMCVVIMPTLLDV